MKGAFRSRHADRVVLVGSDDSGLATGRRLAAEGATVFTVGPFGELRSVGAFARRNLVARRGIEPPASGFSGLYNRGRTNANRLLTMSNPTLTA
jgi:hypothetical protein